MNYDFKGKRTGKSYSQLIQLKQNLDKGLSCQVATRDHERTKRDFEYMTGVKLLLTPIEACKHNIYKATLDRS